MPTGLDHASCGVLLMLLVASKVWGSAGLLVSITSESDTKYWDKLPPCCLITSTHYNNLTNAWPVYGQNITDSAYMTAHNHVLPLTEVACKRITLGHTTCTRWCENNIVATIILTLQNVNSFTTTVYQLACTKVRRFSTYSKNASLKS